MTKVLVDDSNLTKIADAIRLKTGSTDSYKPGEMDGAILSIPSSGGPSVDDYFNTDITSSSSSTNFSNQVFKVDWDFPIYVQGTHVFAGMGSKFDPNNGECRRFTNVKIHPEATSMSYWFSEYIGYLPEFVKDFDTSNITNMADLFYKSSANGDYIRNIQYIKDWDTSKVTTFTYCFRYVAYMYDTERSTYEDVILNWNLDSAINTEYMFASYAQMQNYRNKMKVFSGLYTTENASTERLNTQYMFYNCSYLTKIDMSKVNRSLYKTSSMFSGCSNLTLIDIRGLDWTTASTGYRSGIFDSVPTACPIIVKDEASRNWLQSYVSSSRNYLLVDEAIAQGIITE